MRIKIGNHEVEGTPEEVATLLGFLSPQLRSAPRESETLARASGASPFVSEELAFDVLTRRPLGEVHAKMLGELYEAGEAWTTASELQRTLGLTTREFAGVLGAFGRRLSHTEGAGSRSFFDQYWDHDQGYNLYRLPASVRSAMRKAGMA